MSNELALELDMSKMVEVETRREIDESWADFVPQTFDIRTNDYVKYLTKLDIDPESQPPKMLWQKIIEG